MSLPATLSAYGDIIKGQQDAGGEHEPTPTEYFAVISATLGQATEQSPEFLTDSIKILDAVSLQASTAVVRGQFRSLCASYQQIITLSTDNAQLLKTTLSALGTLLYVQEVSDTFWGNVQALQCLNTLLAFLEDANMKLRKVAYDQLIRLMTLHKEKKSKAFRTYVADFCIGIMSNCNRADYKRSLYIVLFLERAAAYLPEEANYSVRLFETAISLQSSNQPVLTAAVLRAADALFQSPQYSLAPSETASCLRILGKYLYWGDRYIWYELGSYRVIEL